MINVKTLSALYLVCVGDITILYSVTVVTTRCPYITAESITVSLALQNYTIVVNIMYSILLL